jgi:N6-L-threonylcarbamoyladenine synthase
MKILGIETSCDETALALVEISGDKSPRFSVLKDVIASQIDIHSEYGGVVPSLAKREHAKNLIPVLFEILEIEDTKNQKLEINAEDREQKENEFSFSGGTDIKHRAQNQKDKSKIKHTETILRRYDDLQREFKEKIVSLEKPGIDLIAVTRGPGLEPALWTGINFARALSMLWNVPLIGVDHMEGHIAVNLLSQVSANSKFKMQDSKSANEIAFPAISLAVSGGHTQLILVHCWGDYELLGETLDDAAGEAFDKVARLLSLPFPGGPHIEREAARCNAKIKMQNSKIHLKNKNFEIFLPVPMLNSGDLNFSFSGLKTAALYDYKSRSEEVRKSKKYVSAMSSAFQQAVITALISKTLKAAKEYKAKTIMLAGGVAANRALKKQLGKKIKLESPDINYLVPEIKLATDNGVMIAIAGYLRFAAGEKSSWKTLEADSNKLITE